MDARIRVLQVLEATVGGTRRHVLDLCRGLPADRFAVHLACSTLRDAHFEHDVASLRASGIEVTVIPMRREISPLSDARCLLALARLMRQWQPQIVHGHSSKGGFLARMAAHWVGGMATVYNPHGFAFQMRVSGPKRRLYLALERLAGARTDRLVAVGETQRAIAVNYRAIAPERVVVIPCGVRSDVFAPPEEGRGCRDQLKIPPQAKLIGTVGALMPQKGIESLIQAAVLVARQRLDAHFVVAGDGPLRPHLEELIESLGLQGRFHLLGHRRDIPQILAALDLFVLPSLWEGLPYALLEAGAAALPVVATRIEGNVDVIEEGKTGWLVLPNDPVDISRGILEALSSAQAPFCGLTLQRIVRRDYTLDNMISHHASLYEELASRR